ncbi:hypothetical protein OEZ86_009843 [Tetradesmus obliquus]|uniref:Uncharacterized protein n=1 Tax=Tetradesmus obliquus TaxID=3088 RepID=A0ABY8URF7_TETOB|nr:hypothetical protein OEZ85_001281 [Tetradesmus obliquus]WIA43354.1 hypothetical protein OEZ86_009843 [Tetradesmus obliquus]
MDIDRKSSRSPLGHDCLPLVLQQGVEDLQTACTLLQTSKAMRDAALAHCSVPLSCSPTTMEEVERIAAWVAKYGSLLGSFEMELDHPVDGRTDRLNELERAAAFAALGTALMWAEESPHDLRRRPYNEAECVQRLAGVRAALPQLQQLRKLSLVVDCLNARGRCEHLKYVDPLLLQPDARPLLGLTNLTSLNLNSVWSVGGL